MRQAARAVLMAVALLSLLVGCGGSGPAIEPAPPPQIRIFDEFYQAYRLYLDQNKRPPSGPADLHPYTPGFPLASIVMNQEKHVVLWGANPEFVPEPANTVLAYETVTPDSGGWVLMADGSPKQLSAAEFQATRKANSR